MDKQELSKLSELAHSILAGTAVIRSTKKRLTNYRENEVRFPGAYKGLIACQEKSINELESEVEASAEQLLHRIEALQYKGPHSIDVRVGARKQG